MEPQIAQLEERSSLLDDVSMEIAKPEPVHDFKFEVVVPDQHQNKPEQDNKNEGNFFERVAADQIQPGYELSISQFEDKLVINQESQAIKPVAEEELKVPELALQKSAGPTYEELNQIAYFEKLEKVKNRKICEGLKYMFDAGYTNFEINHRLLTKANGDMIVAMNDLCNNNITESMIQHL